MLRAALGILLAAAFWLSAAFPVTARDEDLCYPAEGEVVVVRPSRDAVLEVIGTIGVNWARRARKYVSAGRPRLRD